MRASVRHNVVMLVFLLGPLMFVELVFAYIGWRYHFPPEAMERVMEPMMRVRYLCAISSMLFGLARFGSRHPLHHTVYLRWLALTPWRRGLPLPCGPIMLDVIDAAALMIWLTIAQVMSGLDPVILLLMFMLPYLIAALAVLWRTDQQPEAYMITALVAGLVPVFPDTRLMLVISVAMYALTRIGVHRSLGRFPWGKLDFVLKSPSISGLLSPQPPPGKVPMRKALWGCLLVGWGVFCVTTQVTFENRGEEFLGCAWVAIFGLVVATGRLVNYTARFWPPISLFGRIFTGRLIIAGYDHVYIPLLIVFFAGVAIAPGLLAIGAAPSIAYALGVSVTLMLALKLPPSRARWQLTGRHRILLGGLQQKKHAA